MAIEEEAKKLEGEKEKATEDKKEDGEKGKTDIKVEDSKCRNVETVLFVPATEGSKLRKKLQEICNMMTQATNCPSIRFVESGAYIDGRSRKVKSLG